MKLGRAPTTLMTFIYVTTPIGEGASRRCASSLLAESRGLARSGARPRRRAFENGERGRRDQHREGGFRRFSRRGGSAAEQGRASVSPPAATDEGELRREDGVAPPPRRKSDQRESPVLRSMRRGA